MKDGDLKLCGRRWSVRVIPDTVPHCIFRSDNPCFLIKLEYILSGQSASDIYYENPPGHSETEIPRTYLLRVCE